MYISNLDECHVWLKNKQTYGIVRMQCKTSTPHAPPTSIWGKYSDWSGQVGINIVLNINENYWFSLFCITFNTKNLDRSLTHRSSNVLQKTTKITARRTLASWLFIDNTCSNRQNVCHATMQLLSQFAVLPRLCVFPNNFMLRLELGRVGTTTYLQGYLRNWQTRELSFLSAKSTALSKVT